MGLQVDPTEITVFVKTLVGRVIPVTVLPHHTMAFLKHNGSFLSCSLAQARVLTEVLAPRSGGGP
jgi:hypothetical protein